MSILKCPCCGSTLNVYETETENGEIIEGMLCCQKGHQFKIFRGIADFGSIEQKDANSWSEYYKEMNYEDLDASIDNRKTDHQKEIENEFLDGIIEETSKLEKGFLIDVASGRGMLLRKLLQTTNEQVHIIATDLSFDVLMYDRIKLKSLNPNIKISYIACDATNLPFQDHSIDMVCTFVGYLNMINLMEQGIEEAARVLKENCKLINSVMYIDESSKEYQEVQEILKSNDMEVMAKHLLKEELFKLHYKYFSEVTDRIVYEGIGEKFEGDLLPYEGAWYANSIIQSKKV